MSKDIKKICANCWHIQHVEGNTYKCCNEDSDKYNDSLFLGEDCSCWTSLREYNE